MKRIVIFLLFIMFSAVVVSASSASVKIGNATITVGKHVSIPITIDADEGISCATIVVTYDGDIVRVVSVSEGDFDWLECNNPPGRIKTVAFQTGEEGLKEGTVANLYIEAKKEGYSPLNLEIETLKDNEGTEVPATALNGFISVSSPTASPTPSASPTSTSSPSNTDTTPTPPLHLLLLHPYQHCSHPHQHSLLLHPPLLPPLLHLPSLHLPHLRLHSLLQRPYHRRLPPHFRP